MPVPVDPWNMVTYVCGALTMFFAGLMLTIVICVRVKRRVKYSRKITLHNDGGTQPKTYSCGITRCKATCGITKICCGDSQSYIDEGYVSEMNAGSNSLYQDDDDTITPPTTPNSVQDNPTLAVFVCAPSITQQKSNGTDTGEGEETIDIEGQEHKTKKKKRRRKQKKHHPVMETATQCTDRDTVYIPSVPSAHKTIPETALIRGGNLIMPAMSRQAPITRNEYTGEIHYPQINPQTFINV